MGRATLGGQPPARSYAYLDHPGPIPLVHRAAGGEHPENTLPAILAVVALGFRYVETDARTTADGVAVLAHDADLRRVAGHRVRVADLTSRSLAGLPLGPAAPGGPSVVPRLDEVLDACPDLRLNIDLKDDAAAVAVADALARAGGADRVCVTSFADRRIDAFRRLAGPEVCTGMGVRRSAALWSSARLSSARLLPARLSPERLPFRP
ncbi:MAG: glycerophosphodiester phosphodiesterase, partial [Actinomycetota bacterium]|nr:glycerophosphodiester phosphodiesterase [Actinomycetota bacterium]